MFDQPFQTFNLHFLVEFLVLIASSLAIISGLFSPDDVSEKAGIQIANEEK